MPSSEWFELSLPQPNSKFLTFRNHFLVTDMIVTCKVEIFNCFVFSFLFRSTLLSIWAKIYSFTFSDTLIPSPVFWSGLGDTFVSKSPYLAEFKNGLEYLTIKFCFLIVFFVLLV